MKRRQEIEVGKKRVFVVEFLLPVVNSLITWRIA